MKENIEVSIIIPNLHSPIINRTIDSILSQKTTLSYEIIVVGMDKFGLVKNYPQVIFHQTSAPVNAAKARNIGINRGQGRWFIFIDADCIAQTGWIEAFRNDFNDGWKVIGGAVQSPLKPFWLLVYNLSMFHEYLPTKKRRKTKYLPTLNLAVHREVIEKVGLLDENLVRGQDIDWTSRMMLEGYKLLFNPLANVEHIPEQYDLRKIRAYNHKSGFYAIKVRQKYPEIFHLPKILRASFIMKLLSPFIAAGTTTKIFLKTREVRQQWKTVPFIYLNKLSWCQGASKSLKVRK